MAPFCALCPKRKKIRVLKHFNSETRRELSVQFAPLCHSFVVSLYLSVRGVFLPSVHYRSLCYISINEDTSISALLEEKCRSILLIFATPVTRFCDKTTADTVLSLVMHIVLV